jgi:hypothetical protein
MYLLMSSWADGIAGLGAGAVGAFFLPAFCVNVSVPSSSSMATTPAQEKMKQFSRVTFLPASEGQKMVENRGIESSKMGFKCLKSKSDDVSQ